MAQICTNNYIDYSKKILLLQGIQQLKQALRPRYSLFHFLGYQRKIQSQNEYMPKIGKQYVYSIVSNLKKRTMFLRLLAQWKPF